MLALIVFSGLGLREALHDLIVAHPLATLAAHVLLVFAVFNAFVQALEAPTEHDARLYRTFYRFMHALAFNFRYALRAKFPQYIPPDQQEAK